MRRKRLNKASCPIARALDVIGDWWSLLIVRDALRGTTRFSDFQKSLGLDIEWLNAAEARRREPHLKPGIAAAVFCKSDHQVENRALANALIAACRAAGVGIHEHCPITEIVMAGGRACGVETAAGRRDAEIIVLAAGWRARLASNLAQPSARLPVLSRSRPSR